MDYDFCHDQCNMLMNNIFMWLPVYAWFVCKRRLKRISMGDETGCFSTEAPSRRGRLKFVRRDGLEPKIVPVWPILMRFHQENFREQKIGRGTAAQPWLPRS